MADTEFGKVAEQRIRTWLDPFRDPQGDGYNIIQSLIAFASGKLFGAGFGNSKQKLSWLPEGHTDFIYAIIGEEFGFPVYSVVDVYDIIEYLEEDKANEENVNRIKKYLEVYGAKA